MHAAALVRLTRPLNVLIAVVGVLVGGFAAFQDQAHWGNLALAALVAGFGVAAGNAFNDAQDARVDARVHPWRPIPQGHVTVGSALWVSVVFFAASLTGALATNFLAVLLAAQLVANLLVYELALKRRPLLGNLLVSYNVGCLFLLGGIIAATSPLSYDLQRLAVIPTDPRLIIPLTMGLLAFLLNLAREVYKTIEDAAGDALERRTYAVIHGPQSAFRLAAWLNLSVAPLSLLPYATGVFPGRALWLLGPVLAVVLLTVFVRNARRAQRLVKVAMVLGFVPFLAVGLI